MLPEEDECKSIASIQTTSVFSRSDRTFANEEMRFPQQEPNQFTSNNNSVFSKTSSFFSTASSSSSSSSASSSSKVTISPKTGAITTTSKSTSIIINAINARVERQRRNANEETASLTKNNNSSASIERPLKSKRQQYRLKQKERELQEKIDIMMDIPAEFLVYWNSGNFPSLRSFFQHYFAANCEFQNSFMVTPRFGVDGIYDMFWQIAMTVPDTTHVLDSVEFDADHGIIHANFHFLATHGFGGLPEQMQYCLNPGNRLDCNAPDYDVRLKMTRLLQENKRLEVSGEIKWLLYLDAKMEKVQKFYHQLKMLSADEAPSL